MHIDKKDRKTVVINAIIIKNKGIIKQTNKQILRIIIHIIHNIYQSSA